MYFSVTMALQWKLYDILRLFPPKDKNLIQNCRNFVVRMSLCVLDSTILSTLSTAETWAQIYVFGPTHDLF